MTPEMIARARASASKAGVSNVEFHQAAIDALPLADGSVDCLISNCVINLAPDKRAVFREMARVLRPGGRVAISDIALKRELPEDLARDVMAYVGCIAGAISAADYERGLAEAGLEGVQVVPTGADLNAYAQVEGQSGCCSPAMSAPSATSLPLAGCCAPPAASEVHAGLASALSRYDVNDYAASVRVYAVKGRG
jgi:SAM-dependent methyltransferase